MEGRGTGVRLALFERAAILTAGVRTGDAGMGVNGVNVNGEVRLVWEVRVASSLFCMCASEVGRSLSNCSREPERLSRSVDDGGIERISVAIP